MRSLLRAIALFVACACSAALAEGSIRPRQDLPEGRDRVAAALTARDRKPPARPQYQITAETEVRLDGRPCAYDKVPRDASIVHMEVSPGRPPKILAVHFKSKR